MIKKPSNWDAVEVMEFDYTPIELGGHKGIIKNVEEYIEKYNKHADELLSVSNSIIVYDLIKNASKENVDESQIVGGK